MIHVVATVQVQPGKRVDFLDEFQQVVPFVLKEHGCVQYGPTVDADTGINAQQCLGDDFVVIIERWESVDALKAHLGADHMASYRERVKDLVAASKLQVFQSV